MEPLKIAFLTDRMILGHGVDLVIDNISRELKKSGVRIHVYCNHLDKTFTGRKDYEIVELAPIAAKNTLDLERKTRQDQAFYHEIDADLFIIHSFPFYCLAGLLKRPVIAVNYGVIDTTGMPFRRSLFYRYMDFMQNHFYFKRADQLISISHFLHERLPKAIRRSADVIHLGADHYPKDIPPSHIQAFRQEMGLTEKDVLLLYVGRLNVTNQPYKGVQQLKEMFHELQQKNAHIKLMMAGYGSKNDEERLKNEGILAISNAQDTLMPLLYSACDIYATATLWEGFDLPLVEAQSFSRPVVCYDVGAHPEVTSPESAFMVKGPEAFMEKVLLLAGDPALRQTMGRSAARFAQKFTWAGTAEKYASHIKKMLSVPDMKTSQKRPLQGPPPKAGALLSALILNYDSAASTLKECVASIRENQGIDIIIFDNGSKNDNAKRVQDAFENVRLIVSPVNLGIGAALNQALREIQTPYVLICSFDVVLEKDAVSRMLDLLESLDEKYIGVAPKTLFYHDRDYIENIGICLDNAFYIVNRGIGQLDLGQYDRSEDIFSPSLTCALFRREAFEPFRVGGLDESFFLFYEEADFSYRAALKGYKFRSCPKAVCYHRFAYSFRDDATAYAFQYYYQRLNLLRTAAKNAAHATFQRIHANETAIQKSNLKDRNLKTVAKRILSDYQKSMPALKRQRSLIQRVRKASDDNVISYSWGERAHFDVVTNQPVYSLENLHDTFLRLFVLTKHVKYSHYVDYIDRLAKTRLRMDEDFIKENLPGLLKHEDARVMEFIKRM